MESRKVLGEEEEEEKEEERRGEERKIKGGRKKPEHLEEGSDLPSPHDS